MATFSRINLEQARDLMVTQKSVVADIRDPQSFAAGHMLGAVHLSNENLHDFVLNNPTDTPVIVVCYHGVSSQGAAQYLCEQGFSQVYSLDGGFTAWQQSYPDQVTTQYT